MVKARPKDIKKLIATGKAVELPRKLRLTSYDRIAYSVGQHLINGLLIRDNATNQLYAITSRRADLFFYL